MAKYSTGVFTPKNPNKIAGNPTPTFRSSWELAAFNFFDTHPSVIQWASEPLQIPYVNPLTGKATVYVPDFLLVYKDKFGAIQREMVEIKPKKETLMERAKSRRDKAAVVLNTSKWIAAMGWCKRHGYKFRVLNEDHIFQQKGKK